MGSTTPNSLPFPEDSDTPDIPRDIKALALGVEAALLEARPKPWQHVRGPVPTETVQAGIWGTAVTLPVPNAPGGLYLLLAQFDYTAASNIYFDIMADDVSLSQGSDSGPLDQRMLKTLAGLYLHQQDGASVEFKSKYGFGMGTSSIYGNYTSLSAVWLG